MIAAILVIAFSGSTQEVDARSAPTTPASASRGAPGPHLACPSAHKAVRYYSKLIAYWSAKMNVRAPKAHRGSRCPRYLAHILKAKATLAKYRYYKWMEYHWAWEKWLPSKWQRIGACETGYGRIPGNWRHSNSRYEGAFGFAKQSWDSFKYRADPKAGPYPEDAWQATPRQQYEVALAIYRAYGFSGWGCRGA